ncbi:MAG: VanZ family protein [Candidatus Sulfopaludibacter sp.]|nr:VanZ family protein [Candidatus Sulfopaludibacter sp.]
MNPSRLAGIGMLALIACFALLPQPWKGRLATFGMVHDCAHYAAFLAACILTTWRVRSAGMAARTSLLILLFGILLEFLQTRVYGNHFEYLDVVADAGGVATGLLFRNIREEWYGQ